MCGVACAVREEERLKHREASSAVVRHKECGALGDVQRSALCIRPHTVKDRPKPTQRACPSRLPRCCGAMRNVIAGTRRCGAHSPYLTCA